MMELDIPERAQDTVHPLRKLRDQNAIEQTFNGSVGFGRRVTCQISRNGDLIHRIYLQAVLPIQATQTYVNWAGLRLLKSSEVEIGGQRVDKHYSDWMYIWNELSLPSGKVEGYKQMVGFNPVETVATTIYVPLEFWFCRNVGLALPLIALQYHEVKINIEFETALAMSSTGTVLPTDMSNASLWVDYIFLDTDERRRFAQLSHEYLIEQLQHTGEETVTSGANTVKLNFNHPVKELVWAVQGSAPDQWYNYTTSNVNASTLLPDLAGNVNYVTEALLQLNGHDRFAKRPGTYFNLVQPYQHHEKIPANKGINVYSFALKPEEHQPSGTLNFSRIDTANLKLTLAAGADGYAVAKVKTFATCFNVLRVMSGINRYHLCPRVNRLIGSLTTDEGKRYKVRDALPLLASYNWLVGDALASPARCPGCGNILIASATTHARKRALGTHGNDVGYSKNAEDWTIRRLLPKSAIAMDMVKIQRLVRHRHSLKGLANPRMLEVQTNRIRDYTYFSRTVFVRCYGVAWLIVHS